MRRREFLLSGLAGVTTNSAWAATTGLAVEIDLGGQTYRYDSATGIDLGAYSDPQGQFIQECVRVNHPQLPLSVFIRPDRGTDRLEVVFELGRMWGVTEPQNLPQYKARIIRGTATVATVDVPAHYWFSRWRWQSAPRPVRTTAAQLMGQWLVPQLSDRLHPQPSPIQRVEYSPMGLAGLAAYMGTTGERPEIGLVTEQQAVYLCTGNQAALDVLLAQGEGAASYPWTLRDEKTNAPFDIFAYPRATIYGPQAGNPFIPSAKTPFAPDAAHQPALSYLPFQLTGDPYHLEQLQLIATWNVLWRPWNYRYRTTQLRGEAWSMRTWAQVAKVTPENVPRWLLPQAHWQKLLDSYLDWYLKTFLASTETPQTVFRTTEQDYGGPGYGLAAHTYTYPWEDDFLSAVMGWMILMGHSRWRPVFEWKMGSVVSRTNGSSGWPRSVCAPYKMIMRSADTVPWVKSWKEAWDLTAPLMKYTDSDPDELDLTQLFYYPYIRGSLILAKHLELPDLGPSLDWIEGQLPRVLAARKPFPYKWALV